MAADLGQCPASVRGCDAGLAREHGHAEPAHDDAGDCATRLASDRAGELRIPLAGEHPSAEEAKAAAQIAIKTLAAGTDDPA